MINLGTVRPGTTIYIPWDTFAAATGASITSTGLATTDIEVYKDGSITQRASDNGYTLLDTDGIDLDGITGIQGISINLADNSTAGFYAAGSSYWVVISSVTIDGQTVNFIAAYFTIGYESAVLNTTIATLASQTSFTLTDGPAEDDALNGSVVVIHDIASAVQLGQAYVLDYTGSSKTVTLAAGTTFTAAVGDNISVMPRTDLSYILGTLVSTSTAQLGVNTVNAGGTAWGSGAITAGSIATDAIDADAIAANAIDAGAIATGAITAAKFAAGAIDAAAIATGAIDADALAADAVTEIRSYFAGTADSGTTTTLVDAALTQANTDHWNGSTLLITSGVMAGQVRTITAFSTATDTITFAPALNSAITTETYEILPQGRTIVGALEANVITNTSIASNALSSSKFFTGTITADALAADAVAEIADAVWDEVRSGHVTAGTYGQASLASAPITGTSDAGGSTTTIVDAERTESTTDVFNGSWAVLTSGAGAGAARMIVGFTPASDTISVYPGFPLSIGAGVTYAIVPAAYVRAYSDNFGLLDENAIADGVWDEIRSGHTMAGSYGQSTQATFMGAVASATSSTLVLGTQSYGSAASGSDDFYNGLIVLVIAGLGEGQQRTIVDYVGASKTITPDGDWTTTPDSTSKVVILGV